MPNLEIVHSSAGPAVSVEGAGRLVDLCDEHRAPIAFSCRSGDCGTCRVDVLAGATLLEPEGEDELAVLRSLAAPPGQRLACQVTLRAGGGLVRLRWVGRGARVSPG